MKNFSYALALIFLLFSQITKAQSCDNSDFETGTLNSWNGFTGSCCGMGINNPGIQNGRHTVVGDIGADPLSLDSITFIAPSGGSYSVRLGNANVGSEAEKLTKSFLVTAENTAFTYQYALLLEDPIGHSQNDKPKFEVKLLDENLSLIPGPCGYYQVTAGPETNTWYKNNSIRFKDWATVGIDLTPYIGQVMTIEFSVEDCGLGGHFGYAYIDAKCGFLDVVVHGFCKGDNDSVFVTAPVGFDSYFWPHSGETTRTVMLQYPEVGDSVVVKITNEAGCSSQILHVFEEKEDPSGGATAGGNICAGEEFIIRPDKFNLDWRYVWTNNKTTDVIEDTALYVTPLETTTYYLDILNENGCGSNLARDTVTVVVDNSLFFNKQEVGPFCPNDEYVIKLDTLVGNYTWSVGQSKNLSKSDSVITNLSASQTYTIKAENSNCSWEEELTINYLGGNSIPDTVDLSFCPNADSIVIEIPFTGFVSYVFNGTPSLFDTLLVKNPSDQQKVEVILTSALGCSDTVIYSLNVSTYPVATISLDQDTICFGMAAKVTASGAGVNGTYSWGTNTGAGIYSNADIIYPTALNSGKIWVEALNADGCSNASSRDTIDLTVNSSAIFSLSNEISICLGDSILIDPVGGSGTYSWTSSLNDVNSADSTIKVAPKTTAVYYLNIKNGNCNFSDYQKVNVITSNFTSSVTVDYCESKSSIDITGPAGYNSYEWINESDNDQIGTINNLSDGKNVVLALVSTQSCKDTLEYVLNKILYPTFSVSNDETICLGDEIKLSANSNYANNKYSWSSIPAGFSSTNAKPSVSPSVTTQYIATYTNAINCINSNPSDTVLITVDNSTINNLGNDWVICEGETVALSSSKGSGNYLWTSNPAGFSSQTASVTVSPTISTTYTQVISNVNCSSSDNVFVKVNPIPKPFIANYSLSACTDEVVILEMTNFVSGTYLWTLPNNTTSSAATLTVPNNLSGKYYLSITDLNDCSNTDSVSLTFNDIPTANSGTPEICGNNTAELVANTNPNYTYLWSTGETTNSIIVVDKGTYSYTITNGKCKIQGSFDVSKIAATLIGEIPNIFTPNSDGINDKFIVPFDNVLNYEIKIYDRWGKKVFESTDINTPWDGSSTFFKVSNGVYFYTITYETDCSRGNNLVNGFVEVVKD